MSLCKRSAADFQAMPWKNGGGVTLQLAVWPPQADLAHFDWRVSSAHVARSGAFSRFDGMDRSLAVLDGGSLQLSIDDPTRPRPTTLSLAPGMQLDGFAGEWAIDCQIADGQTVTDFNVMTRRSRCRHRLQRLHTTAGLTARGAPWLLYLTAGCLQTGSLTLQAGELLSGHDPLRLQGQAEGWLVQISDIASPSRQFE